MTGAVAARHRFAADLVIGTAPGRVLEIGCGHGVASGLVAASIGHGTVTALDRSAKMIAATGRRNGEAVADGRLLPVCGAFEDANLYGKTFDAIFAVNVDFPAQGDAPWAERLVRLLAPDGEVILVMEPPPGAGARAHKFAEAARATLATHGLAADIVEGPAAIVAVRARRR